MYVEIGAHNRNTTRLVTEKFFALVMSIIMIVSERIKCFASIDSCCLIFLFYSFSYGHVGWDHGSIYPPCKLIAVHCKMQELCLFNFGEFQEFIYLFVSVQDRHLNLVRKDSHSTEDIVTLMLHQRCSIEKAMALDFSRQSKVKISVSLSLSLSLSYLI